MSPASVLIPNFNGRRHLAECLGSLQQQRCPVGEIIVFDNGSTDGSADFIRQRFPQVRVLGASENFGFAGAINRAAEAATGEWLAFLNNDMRAAPEWVAGAMEHAGRHPCVASRILNWSGDKVDFDGASLQYLGFADQVGIGEPATRPSQPGFILFPCGGAMFIRRDLFLSSGGLDEDYFAVYEDVDLGWRLWLQGHQVFFSPDSVACHRGHATLDARREEKKRYLMHRNALFTILKNYGDEAFRKILPAAFFQSIRRAVRFSGIDKTAFYFWEEREIAQDTSSLWMLKDAVNHLVALDDVLEHWPELMKKRARVQAGRKRSDGEILSLFHDPFRRIFKDANYEEHEAEWIQHLGILELFPGADPFALTEGFAGDQKREMEALRRELAHLKSGLAEFDGRGKPQRSGIRKLAQRLAQWGAR